jgi:GxxExxY protein
MKATEKDISKIAVDCIYTVHKAMGPGLLESTYETCLEHELLKRGLKVEKQKMLPVIYDDLKIDNGYRLDLVIEDDLIIELKSVDKMLPVFQAQMMTYLRLSGIKTGLLVNFNVPLIKDGIKRISI